MTDEIEIAAFAADDILAHRSGLGELMHACVHAGASIGYVLPFTEADGEAFWTGKVMAAVSGGKLCLLVALQGGRIAGSAQLDWDTPPNQPHRAEVRKLLVHPLFRRRGIARALMAEIELRARMLGRSLMTLDTRTGDAAEPLYASMGYQSTGIIPGYCIDAISGARDSTTIMYKHLTVD